MRSRRWHFWCLGAPLLAQMAGLVAGLILAVAWAPGVTPADAGIVAAGILLLWSVPLLVQLVALVEGLKALSAERASNGRWWRIAAEALLCATLAGLFASRFPWAALFVPVNVYLAVLAGFYLVQRRRGRPHVEARADGGVVVASGPPARRKPGASRRLGRLTWMSLAGVVCLAAVLALLAAALVFASRAGELVGEARSPDGAYEARVSFIDWSAGAMSAGNDGLWRVTVSHRQVDGWSTARTIFLAMVPAMDSGGRFPLHWQSGNLLSIAGKTYDVRTARTIHSRGLSPFQYAEGGIEVAIVFAIVLAIGVVVVRLWFRRSSGVPDVRQSELPGESLKA